MYRSEVRHNEIWLPGTNVASLQRSTDVMDIPANTDLYIGLRFYLYQFSAVRSTYTRNIWEMHGDRNQVQAPFHLYTDGGRQLLVDLNIAATGFTPVFQSRVGSISGNSGHWVDCVLRFYGRTGNDGRYTFWMKPDGTGPMTSADIKKDYTGQTWGSQLNTMYLIVGLYQANAGSPASQVAYFDSVRVGDTLGIVDPGNY
jgi:hypothetical protein